MTSRSRAQSTSRCSSGSSIVAVVGLCGKDRTTTATIELPELQRLVDWALERDVILVHDFAYAETAFDGWKPPSILQCRGGKEVAVELYSMTKSFSCLLYTSDAA